MTKPDQRQGRRLISLLKRKGMTTLELQMTGISTAPWKRVAECLQPGELLTKTKNDRGLFVYRVVNISKTYKPSTVWIDSSIPAIYKRQAV